jgi:(2Fe-2S) ferredoxin
MARKSQSALLIISYLAIHLNIPWLLRVIRGFLPLNPRSSLQILQSPEVKSERQSSTTSFQSGTAPENPPLVSILPDDSPEELKISPPVPPTDASTVEVPLPEECSACMNSVTHIDRHIIICDTSEWVPKLEKEEGTFPHALYRAIQQAKIDCQSDLEIKVTACQEPNESPDHVAIFVYPERVKYLISRTNEEEIRSFANMMVSIPNIVSSCSAIPWKKLILVCVHGSRDKRCGRIGPMVMTELLAELQRRGIPEEEVAVRGSSHIGGHKYAGTLIVYPTGQWYGLVTPKVVPELLSCIERGEVLNRCFRGYSNSNQRVDW